LLLVDPLGGRYRVAVLPAPPYYGLLDWAGDGHRVLISTPPKAAGQRSEIEDVDLGTGQVLHHFAASSDDSYQYTRPDGLAILASGQSLDQGEPASLVRLNLSGARELTYPTSFPGVGTFSPNFSSGTLPSLDGTELVVEARTGMALLANNGTFVRDLGPTGQSCTPERWWGPTELVASCQRLGDDNALPALWLVPTAGQAGSQLTFPKPPDLGDLDGWRVGTSVYTQAAGACGSEFLAVREPDGGTKPVSVPHARLDVIVVGADGTRLALQAKLGCGQATSLFWFNPQTATETSLLGPPLEDGTVLAALPYPGLES
jgi:TolB protein